jgi:hypothetical protein
MPSLENRVRVAIIASGQPYQEAAAWAAATFGRYGAHANSVSVFLPENEMALDLLKIHSTKFGFSVKKFPFHPISEKKFTSQLKCQAYLFAVSQLREREPLFLVDADTCCFKPLTVPLELKSAIQSGKIGLVPDIADHHSQNPADPWYLTPQERLTYVNSGVILASRDSLRLFEVFRKLSEQEPFLRGPFNDQKIINFALGKYFRNKLLLLDKAYNNIGFEFSKKTIIGHFAGGAGHLGNQQRKHAHQAACAELLREMPPSATRATISTRSNSAL